MVSSIEPADEKDHTYIQIKPDSSVFGDLRLTCEGVNERAEKMKTHLMNLRITVAPL